MNIKNRNFKHKPKHKPKHKHQFNRFNQKKNKHPYYFFNKKKKMYKKKDIYYLLGEKRPEKPLMAECLYRLRKKKKIGIFFKTPSFKHIAYPFYLNLKLVNEYLKKK